MPRILGSDVVYHGRLFDVELDTLEMDGGVVAKREILKHPGAVCMIPVTQAGEILLVTQYRHAAGKRLLELPAGTLGPGEDPRAAAVRELQEEVGMHPGTVEEMGGFYVAPGYTTEYIRLYTCTHLSPAKLAGDDDEDIEVETVSLEDALARVESGEICDAKSVVGILRYAAKMRR